MVAVSTYLTIFLAAGASALPTRTVEDRATPTTWNIQVWPSAPPQKFNGTITEVFTEVLKTNPNFEADFPTYKKQLIGLGWLTAAEAAECEKAANITVITKRMAMPSDDTNVTQWSLPVWKSEKPQKFNGTLTSALTQVLKTNTNWNSDFPTYRKQLIAMGWITSDEVAEAETAAGVSTTDDSSESSDKVKRMAMPSDNTNVTQWSLPVWKSEKPQKFNGTLTSALTQVLKTNTNWNSDFPTYKKQLIAMGWITSDEVAEAETAAGVSNSTSSSSKAKRGTSTLEERSSSPTQWSIQVWPTSKPQEFNGTIDKVFTKVLVQNNNFEVDFPTYKKQLIAMGWLTSEQAAACEEEANVTAVVN